MTLYVVLEVDGLNLNEDIDILGVCETLDKAIELGARKGTFEAEWEINHFLKTGSLDDGSYKLELIEKELTK